MGVDSTINCKAYVRIMAAMRKGVGVRLSFDECLALSLEPAVSDAAENYLAEIAEATRAAEADQP